MDSLLQQEGALRHRIISLLLENPQYKTHDMLLVARMWMDEMTDMGYTVREPFPVLLNKMFEGGLTDMRKILSVKKAYLDSQTVAVKYQEA